MLLCFINPRVRKIRNEASSCSGIFSRTLRFGRAASAWALAPEPPRATGVGPEVIGVQICHFFDIFFEIRQIFNFFVLRSVKVFFLHFLGLCTLINPFFARTDVSHPKIWDRTKFQIFFPRSDKVYFVKRRGLEKIPVQLKASFLIFLTLGLIKQSNTINEVHLKRFSPNTWNVMRAHHLVATHYGEHLLLDVGRCFWQKEG